MRKLLPIVVAAFAFSASAQDAEQNDAARNWYLPPSSKAVTQNATLYYPDDKTSENKELTCTVDVDGKICCFVDGALVDVREYFEGQFFSPELCTAVSALQSALLAQYEIQNLGQNLQKALGAERTYTIKQGAQATVTVKIPGIDIGASATPEAPGGNIQTTGSGIPYPDNKTIAKDNNGKWHLKDWEVVAGSDTLANALADNDKNIGRGWSGYQVLVRSAANGDLGYLKIGSGIGAQADDSTISSTSQGRLEIKGWASEGAAKSESAWVFPYARGAQDGVKWSGFGNFFSDKAFYFDDDAQSGLLYPRGWRGEVEENAETLTQMLSNGSSEGRGKNYVLARVGTGEEAVLGYVPIGEGLDGVTWATNWTEAVEHITKEETIQIVSFVTNSWNHENFITNTWNHENFITNTWNHENFITNTWNHENFITNTWNHENFITNTWNHENFITNTWNHENFITNTWNHENFITNMWNHENFLTNVVNHENFITNVIDAYSTISNFHEFVTFQTNSYERLHTIENWNYVTNFIVRYLGGMDSGGDGGGGSGGDEDKGPTIEPEDDPYSEEYVPEKIDDFLLPVKNARNIVAITNEPFSKLDATKMLDFQSIDTNKQHLAQLYGFDDARTGTTPVKRSDGEDGYKLEWVEHPEALLAITTNGIAEIRQWMVKNNVTNIFTSVVSNTEAVATMGTNIFAHVKAETMLDNESVWTNGARRVEIKGYKTAPLYTVPYIDYSQSTYEAGRDRDMVWERLPFADYDAEARFGIANAPRTICATTSGTADSEYTVKMLSLYGFGNAQYGHVPVKEKVGNGDVITWKDVSPKYDEVSIVTNTDGKVALKGFAAAEVGTVPQKTANGLEWLKASSATNILLAGAGINITDNGGGVITISARELSTTNTPYGNLTYLTVLTDARYDAASHKMQVKRRTLTFYGVAGEETEWEDVFEAVSHKSEHIATE